MLNLCGDLTSAEDWKCHCEASLQIVTWGWERSRTLFSVLQDADAVGLHSWSRVGPGPQAGQESPVSRGHLEVACLVGVRPPGIVT
jgi:hypothetical protein